MDKLEHYISAVLNTTIFFVVVFLLAWIANGYFGYHFDLGALSNFYIMIAGIKTAGHGINSVFNSPRGEEPDGKK